MALKRTTEPVPLRGWLPGDVPWIEVQAARVYSTLNGCSFDLEETYPITALRPLGWGARIGMYAFGVVFCILCMFQTENPVWFYAPFSRERNRYGHLTGEIVDLFEYWGWVVVSIWGLNLLLCVLTYAFGRMSKSALPDGCFSTIPFVACTRASLHGTACSPLLYLLVLLVHIGCAGALGLTIFTLVLNAYVVRNQMASLLLGLIVLCDVLATVADALSLGGPYGIRVRSKWASWFAAVRVVAVTPLTALVTLCFVVLVHPPQ
jgi:hypothetical protein